MIKKSQLHDLFQVCYLVFKMRTATKSYVKIQPGNITYGGKKKLVEFLVTNVTVRDYDVEAQRDTKVNTSVKYFIQMCLHFLGYSNHL